MQTLSEIRLLLRERGLEPKRSLGQNFLHDHNLIRRLVEAAEIGPGQTVLEVGPGTGALTEWLLERGARVIACELDSGLAALLRDRFASPAESGGFVLIEGDCLENKHALNPDITRALGECAFKLVANLPYGAASPLMATLATVHHPAIGAAPACLGQFVTIQKEVAERLRASPGGKAFGELGVVVQAMATVMRIATLPPGCFWPQPKVTSEMVSIIPRGAPLTTRPDELAAVCHTLFSRRRKQLGTILASAGLTVPLPVGVTGAMRPEQLSVQQIVALADGIAAAARQPGLESDAERCGPA